MGKVVLDITMSLDGFSAGPNVGSEHPMGEGGLPLHDWLFGDKTDADAQILAETTSSGAVIVGGRTYHIGIDGDWGGVTPFDMPAFVVTQNVPTEVREGFTFVPDGIEKALEKAKAVAGDKNVWVMGGANIIQQCLKAGLFDEFHLHIAPLLLGDGTRLFENIGSTPIKLETFQVIESPRVTHLKLRLVKEQ